MFDTKVPGWLKTDSTSRLFQTSLNLHYSTIRTFFHYFWKAASGRCIWKFWNFDKVFFTVYLFNVNYLATLPEQTKLNKTKQKKREKKKEKNNTQTKNHTETENPSSLEPNFQNKSEVFKFYSKKVYESWSEISTFCSSSWFYVHFNWWCDKSINSKRFQRHDKKFENLSSVYWLLHLSDDLGQGGKKVEFYVFPLTF